MQHHVVYVKQSHSARHSTIKPYRVAGSIQMTSDACITKRNEKSLQSLGSTIYGSKVRWQRFFLEALPLHSLMI